MTCAAAGLYLATMSAFALAAGATEALSLSPASGIVWLRCSWCISGRGDSLIVQDHRFTGEIKLRGHGSLRRA